MTVWNLQDMTLLCYYNPAAPRSDYIGNLTEGQFTDFNSKTLCVKSFVSWCRNFGTRESNAGRFLFGGKVAKRKTISKKTRFEVFKRDSFTCQYCGGAAPTVILRVDHIQPVSKEGDDDVLNLITACFDCNAGKSDRLLSDDSAIQKQKAQLDELNERREQLEMMIAWRDGLKGLDEMAIHAAETEWFNLSGGYSPTETGLLQLRKLINKFGLNAVLDAMQKTIRYFEVGKKGYTAESVQQAWNKIGGICQLATLPEWKQQIYHVRNIARSKMYYGCSNSSAADILQLFEEAYHAGWPIETLKELAMDGLSYSALCKELQDYIKHANKQNAKDD